MGAAQSEATEVHTLEARVAVLEAQVQTLTAAVDAASRLQLSAAAMDRDVRVVGGRRVRFILEKDGLVCGYPEQPRPDRSRSSDDNQGWTTEAAS